MGLSWRIDLGDAANLPLPDQSVDLIFGSPPYCDARTYGIGAQRGCAEWIEWMLGITAEACRVSRGLVLWVCAGVTRQSCYWPAPEGLLYRWAERGGQCWRPAYWHRVGIPGSGGPQWLRADVEYILAFKPKGRIPWADNKANGHPPKWPAGGKLSYRDANGIRRHKIRGISGYNNGDATYHATDEGLLDRAITEIANPGNLIQGIVTGGGKLGHPLAHENEAPFPLKLAEWFIRGWCPPGGTVCDPFSGSGTTAHAAFNLGRSARCFDIRVNQVILGRKRMTKVRKTVCATN